MKKICTMMLALLLAFTCSACSGKKATAKKENKTQTDLKEANSKSLVVYFSWSGNTQNIAKEIQKQTNSDIFEIGHLSLLQGLHLRQPSSRVLFQVQLKHYRSSLLLQSFLLLT